MLAVLGGLGAAICFATATLCSSRSSRLVGPQSVLAGVMLTGLVVVLPALVVVGVPDRLGADEVGWLLLSGGGNVVGLLLAYSALRIGKVGLVAPILSTEGALAAALAVVAGEPLEAVTAVLLAAIAIGIALAAAAPDDGDGRETAYGDDRRRSVALAVLGACAFGASLYATGRVSETVAIPWVLLPARLIGVLAVGVPLLLRRRWRMTRRALPLVVTAGVCEVVGFASFAAGSRHGLAVAAVLASQFAAISGVVAYLLWRERLTRLQLAGVTVVVLSVTALSVARA